MSGIHKLYKAIVIGTSAGGLMALTTLLEALPLNFPLPIIVVQHRSKDQRELLEEVLQNKCIIRIKQADEKEKIYSGFVYFAPPDYHLLIESDHTFSLSADAPVRFSRPSIDVLFETAAVVFREELISIILTGANNDGSEGTVAVRKHGGFTIAQNPADANYPFMPTAAIRTQAVKEIWTLQEIRSFLLKITGTYNEENG
jgi:two-component system, chemotaxis family, protein-glutamate methylesterase/glutaminase